jgi:iron(III) transport system ATP-binding protein
VSDAKVHYTKPLPLAGSAPTDLATLRRMSTAIDIREVSKVYPPQAGIQRTTAVDRITLSIPPGELFFLLGPSGCGKTTLLRMIAGFIEPTGGSIAFNGKDVTFTAPNKRNTGMVFQSYALWPHMTVAGNVGFGLDIRSIKGADKDKRIAEALSAVRMENYAARKPTQLSGGQQQRVALARALVIRPDVLLLDEPLSNLDAKLRIELRSEIRRICKASGITTIYVTHDQKEALSMADRIAIIDQGQLVQLGTPADLYRKPASKFVAEFLGETNFVEGTVADLSSSGSARTIAVDTPAGRVVSTGQAPDNLAPGTPVLLSLRPECLKLVEPGTGANRLSGKVLETTYLGELAQHVVELKPAAGAPTLAPLRIAQLNPAASSMIRPGSDVTVAIQSDDVVLVPARG